MSPEQTLYCLQALSESCPEHITDEAWHDVQEMLQEVEYAPIKNKYKEALFYEEIYKYSTD